MESKQERHLLDDVVQIRCGLLISNRHLLGELLECYHDFVGLMGLQELVEGQRGQTDSFTLSLQITTLTVSILWDFSATKRPAFITI